MYAAPSPRFIPGTVAVERTARILVENHQCVETVKVEFCKSFRPSCHNNIRHPRFVSGLAPKMIAFAADEHAVEAAVTHAESRSGALSAIIPENIRSRCISVPDWSSVLDSGIERGFAGHFGSPHASDCCR